MRIPVKNLQIAMVTNMGIQLIGIIKNWDNPLPCSQYIDTDIAEWFGESVDWRENTYWMRNLRTLAARAEGMVFR